MAKLNKLYKIPDMEQNRIKIKNTDLMDDIKIKTNNSLNENKMIKNKNQNAESLIEYFEGMILKYINLYESRGENVDKIKKFILNEDKYTKFKSENNDNINMLKGGYSYDDIINTNNNEYILKLNSTDDKWGIIKIEYNRKEKEKYIIHISHTYGFGDTHNDFNLEIDLHKCIITDYKYQIYSNIFTHTINITGILETIIKKLMDYDYKDDIYINNINNIELTLTNDISTMPKVEGYDSRTLVKSIISTLILILTLRKGTDKNIYKKYNNTFLLLGICNCLLYRPFDNYVNSAYLFNGNNYNQLTFEEKRPYEKIIAFHGDCMLNILICKSNTKIQELLIEKIKYIENKEGAYDDEYYYNEIRDAIVSFETTDNNNCINLLLEYVEGYQSFIYEIKNNYQKLKNDINNIINMKLMMPYINDIINIIQINNNSFANIYFKQNITKVLSYLKIINNNIKDENINNINNNYYNKLLNIYNNFNNTNINFINNDYINNIKKGVATYIYNINIEVKKLFDNLLKYIHVLRNNLLDYYIEKTEAENICEKLRSNLITINNIINEINDGINNGIDNIFNKIDNIFNTYNKFIEIMDCLIKNNHNKFNIFYINILISLILVKEKINYLFNDDIMSILKYMNKNNIIHYFRNVGENINETRFILPDFYESNRERYLFMGTVILEDNHAVLSIIKIDNNNNSNNNKIYLCDINNLYIICHENFNSKNISYNLENDFDEYTLNNIELTLLKNKFQYQISKTYLDEIKIKFYDIKRMSIRNTFNLTNLGKLINNTNPFDIYGEFGNGKLDTSKLLTINYNYCDKSNLKNTYINIKKAIFQNLLNCCANLSRNSTNIYDRALLLNIYYKIDNLINDNTYTLRNLLFKFIKCIIEAKYGTLIIYEKRYELGNCFNNTYNLNAELFINILNADSFMSILNTNNQILKKEIINIINMLNIDLRKYNLEGGYENINYCNNSIIKKVLIVLLIILIIIIIVLIVLYIINKYKNNNNFK